MGNLKQLFDPVGANREWPDGFPIQIQIQDEVASIWTIEEGGVLEPLPGDSVLLINVDGTTLIEYIAGTDTFTEIWSISLNQIGPNSIRGFVSRTVHNIAVRTDSPWRVFPVYSVITMQRQR